MSKNNQPNDQPGVHFPVEAWQIIAKWLVKGPYEEVADIKASMEQQINSELIRINTPVPTVEKPAKKTTKKKVSKKVTKKVNKKTTKKATGK